MRGSVRASLSRQTRMRFGLRCSVAPISARRNSTFGRRRRGFVSPAPSRSRRSRSSAGTLARAADSTPRPSDRSSTRISSSTQASASRSRSSTATRARRRKRLRQSSRRSGFANSPKRRFAPRSRALSRDCEPPRPRSRSFSRASSSDRRRTSEPCAQRTRPARSRSANTSPSVVDLLMRSAK